MKVLLLQKHFLVFIVQACDVSHRVIFNVDMAELLSTRYDYFSSICIVVYFFKGSKVEMKFEAWCAIRADLVC